MSIQQVHPARRAFREVLARMRLALTFDCEFADSPRTAPGTTQRILDLLAERNALGTFFLQGRWAQGHPDLARRIHDAGHLIGSHSFSHAPMPMFIRNGMDFEIEMAERVIREATGEFPARLFRPPYGQNSVLFERALREHGYESVLWDASSDDWKATSSLEVVDNVMKAPDGAVVLMHSWPVVTPLALERLLDQVECIRLDDREAVPA